jgi:hypothetical protein
VGGRLRSCKVIVIEKDERSSTFVLTWNSEVMRDVSVDSDAIMWCTSVELELEYCYIKL